MAKRTRSQQCCIAQLTNSQLTTMLARPLLCEVGMETNGCAADVRFEGHDAGALIALIEVDCYIGSKEGQH